jgi:hypothetical protein
MINTYIAFFDVLGFKEFIFNNDIDEIERIFDHLLRDSQIALSGETYKQLNPGMIVPDLKNQKINCLHISDSIIFWSNTDSIEDFNELVNVCYTFYWRSLQSTFPLRGCLTYGEVAFRPTKISTEHNATFYNSSLIGKGLVNAYLKAESINFAGCILDESVIQKIGNFETNKLLQHGKICYYKVPYKEKEEYEHVFRPTSYYHNDTSFRNAAISIKSLFTYPSKTAISAMSASVKLKLNNTIDFINNFRTTDKEPEKKEKH